LFLSKAERDYLLSVDRQKTNHDYVCVKSRLHKKLKAFVDQELPLLVEKGYLVNDIAEFRNIAENCNPQRSSLVKVPTKTGGLSLEDSNDYKSKDKKSIGRKGFEPLTPAMSRLLIWCVKLLS
jgi:hypothetical protein